MAESQLRTDLTRSPLFPLTVDRRGAGRAWYEMVPRSQGLTPGQHGTFKIALRGCRISRRWVRRAVSDPDSSDRPHQPQGRNNAVTAAAGDPGSPTPSAPPKRHDAVHPELGRWRFPQPGCGCKQHDIEVALDFAYSVRRTIPG